MNKTCKKITAKRKTLLIYRKLNKTVGVMVNIND